MHKKSLTICKSGIKTTVQFNTKIFYPKSENKAPLFFSDQVRDVDFSEDKCNFYAENCAIELSEDGKTYTIKSMVNEGSIVNLKITQVAPAFQVGTDGTTYFGPDAEAPWGSMRHAFWPRNKCEGSIVIKDGPVNFNGNGLFVYAIQGMKPHHAAAKWKFADFQGPNYSAVMMEFTTPPSYGSTVVTVGGLVKNGEIITAGSSCTASHQKVKEDPENEWPEPEEVSFEWKGKTKDGKDVDAVLAGPLNDKIDRIDVMFHVPGFVKKIVAGAAGTKPYIYQVCIPYSSSASILTMPLVLPNRSSYASED
jgi:hypothetical protein